MCVITIVDKINSDWQVLTLINVAKKRIVQWVQRTVKTDNMDEQESNRKQ